VNILAAQNRYTKRPRQPPLPSQLDALQLRVAVALITLLLLTLLIPLPLFMGGGIFVIMTILFFGNCCESLECEENISKLKM
jgi:hypothetical protein